MLNSGHEQAFSEIPSFKSTSFDVGACHSEISPKLRHVPIILGGNANIAEILNI
jgi:hypothetical protein